MNMNYIYLRGGIIFKNVNIWAKFPNRGEGSQGSQYRFWRGGDQTLPIGDGDEGLMVGDSHVIHNKIWRCANKQEI